MIHSVDFTTYLDKRTTLKEYNRMPEATFRVKHDAVRVPAEVKYSWKPSEVFRMWWHDRYR